MSKSRQKGTGGEREVLKLVQGVRPNARRTPPGSQFDIESQGTGILSPIKVLATRPDRGRWLAVIDLEQFLEVLELDTLRPLLVECKRRKTYSHHTMFETETG
jgi:hypothetical protein